MTRQKIVQPENETLDEFKVRVARTAVQKAAIYGWCDEIYRILDELGIKECIPSTFTVVRKNSRESYHNWQVVRNNIATLEEAQTIANQEIAQLQRDLLERQLNRGQLLEVSRDKELTAEVITDAVNKKAAELIEAANNYTRPNYPKFRIQEVAVDGSAKTVWTEPDAPTKKAAKKAPAKKAAAKKAAPRKAAAKRAEPAMAS